MPTEKPRVTFTVSKDMLSDIDEYRFNNKIKNQTQAIITLLEKGLSDMTPVKGKDSPKISDEAQEIAKDYDKLDARGKSIVKVVLKHEGSAVAQAPPKRDTSKTAPLPKARKNRYGFIEIRVYDQPAAAGLGNYLDDPAYHIEQYEEGVIHPYANFGIVITGDSMEPKIHDGGTVFVQASISVDPGKIGIFVLNGQAYCKKLAVNQENRQVRLVSLNPKYEDILVREDDSFRTIGRVLGQYTPGYPNDDIFGW